MPNNWKPKQTVRQKKQYMFQYNKTYRDRMVNIGSMVQHWKAIKEESGCLNDPEVARLLIECYYESKGRIVDFSNPEWVESINTDGTYNTGDILADMEESENDMYDIEMDEGLADYTSEPEQTNISNSNAALETVDSSDISHDLENDDENVKSNHSNHSKEEAVINNNTELKGTKVNHDISDSDGIKIELKENCVEVKIESSNDENDSDKKNLDEMEDEESENDVPLDLSDSTEKKPPTRSDDEDTQDVDFRSLKFKVKVDKNGKGRMVKPKTKIKTTCTPPTRRSKRGEKKSVEKKKPEKKPRERKRKTNSEKSEKSKPNSKVAREEKSKDEEEEEPRLAPQKPWIHIKLEDNPDKYTIEKVESFERRNRGAEVFECMYSCLICKQFKSVGKEIFEEHLEFHVNKVYECSTCQYVGFSNSDMYKHKGNCCKVKKGREYVCHLCGAKLISRGDKVDHMGTVHNIPELPCRWCKELFTTRNFRKKHYRAMHTEQCQYCDSCKMGLSKLSRAEYKKHIETCVPGHQCQYCGKLFTRKQGLDSHVTFTHLKVRKYACQLCPYTATTPEKLKLHVLAHQGIRPYSCDQCTFTCVQPYQLKSHMRTHTGEKPFKCDQCNYAAAWNVQLKEHKKAHTTETAAICHYCSVVFKNMNLLTTHQKKGQCCPKTESLPENHPYAGSVYQPVQSVQPPMQLPVQQAPPATYSPQSQQHVQPYSPQQQIPAQQLQGPFSPTQHPPPQPYSPPPQSHHQQQQQHSQQQQPYSPPQAQHQHQQQQPYSPPPQSQHHHQQQQQQPYSPPQQQNSQQQLSQQQQLQQPFSPLQHHQQQQPQQPYSPQQHATFTQLPYNQ